MDSCKFGYNAPSKYFSEASDMSSKFAFSLGVLVLAVAILLGLGLFAAPPTLAQAAGTSTPTPTPIPDDAHTETFADFLVLRYDPKTQTLFIEPINPKIKIVIRNQVGVTGAAAPAATAAPTPTAAPLDASKLRGKIIFKSTRDGGEYPKEFLYYIMNPDGTDVQRVDTQAAKDLLDVIQGLEGFSPDRTKVVMGDRDCGSYEENECSLYILTPAEHAAMIFSDEEPSQGEWFAQKDMMAKEPVWSPRGDYIVFASNHESPPGCRKTENIFKGTPGQKPVIRRLTSNCAGADSGRPSFSPDGSQVVYWSQFPGPNRELYVIDVGADDSFDWRSVTPKQITFEGDNWDPLWIK